MTVATPESAPAKVQVNAQARETQLTRGILMRSLEGDLTEAHWLHQTLPCRSNLCWIVGHLALVLDRNFMKAIGGQSTLPESYAAIFGMGTQPSANASDYPPIAELTAAVNGAFDRFIAQLETLTDEDLAKPIPPELPFPPMISLIGDVVSLANIHTAYHTGQIGMLRRAQGLPTGLGR